MGDEADETIIWTDASGRVCDEAQAAGGEIIEHLDDGTTRSTLFVIEPAATTEAPRTEGIGRRLVWEPGDVKFVRGPAAPRETAPPDSPGGPSRVT
jgi:hypothetical protein